MGKSYTLTYSSWKHMMSRCFSPRAKEYRYYGGRGITVCERWRTYENFLADMGERPERRFSIDRIDHNGNYEPSNCRWADKVEQARNRSLAHMITAFGRTLNLVAWAEETGIPEKLIAGRLKRGWKPEDAVAQPVLRNSTKYIIPGEHLVKFTDVLQVLRASVEGAIEYDLLAPNEDFAVADRLPVPDVVTLRDNKLYLTFEDETFLIHITREDAKS